MSLECKAIFATTSNINVMTALSKGSYQNNVDYLPEAILER